MVIKCRSCKEDKNESEFKIFKGKRNKTCIKCREKNNLWYSQDKDGRKTKAKERYIRIKEKVSQYRSDRRLKIKYSLDRKEWEEMLTKQDNKCLICGSGFETLKPCVDHDHRTGKVRALLCRRCNLDLQVVENQDFMEKALKYLASQ